MQVRPVLKDYCVIKTAKQRQFIWTEKGDAITIFGIDRSGNENILHFSSRARQEEAIISAKPKQCRENVPAVNRSSVDTKITRSARLKFFYIYRKVPNIDRIHFCIFDLIKKRPVVSIGSVLILGIQNQEERIWSRRP
jgi:hypothetical protein